MKYSNFKLLVLTFSFLLTCSKVYSYAPDSVNSGRLTTVLISGPVAYTGGILVLNELWYKNFPRKGFHTFDDSKEWMQVDKVGHFYSSFHISHSGSKILQWTGLSENKSDRWGGIIGIAAMIPIEILDGFSAQYGASITDLTANLAGAGLYIGQKTLWNELRIYPKYSFTRSLLADYRPEVLGKNIFEQIVKDYNGQTYWLSFDLQSFLGEQSRFPSWLNFTIGYGAHNMVYATNEVNIENGYTPYRQFYFGPDLDLSHISTKSSFLNTLLFIANMIRIPAPALEYNSQDKLIFHFLYF